jgi:hypothetical protein
MATRQIDEEGDEILWAIQSAADPQAESWEEDEAAHDVALLARLGHLALAAKRLGVTS